MRLALLALALALSSCVTVQARDRYVLLESEQYRCGAAEGLGCGLALAPVMEQVDALDGVDKSRVSWDGRRFLIELEPGADVARTAAKAASVLGKGTTRASGGEEADAVDRYRRGERWFDSQQTVELSREEARQISARLSAHIAGELGLDEKTAERLEEVMLAEARRAFEQAHEEGGGVWRLWEQRPEAQRRFEERIAEFLTPEQCSRVSAILAREHEG